MNKKNIEILYQKRKELQLQLAVTEFYSYSLNEWMQLYDSWQQLPIQIELVYLCFIEPQYKEALSSLIEKKGKMAKEVALNLILPNYEDSLIPKLELIFPSKNLLSYVPDLKLIGNYSEDSSQLLHFFQEKSFMHASVYVFYSRYTPVIKLPLHYFINFYSQFKVTDYYDDILLFPADYSWLLCCLSDDSWQFDYRKDSHLSFSSSSSL